MQPLFLWAHHYVVKAAERVTFRSPAWQTLSLPECKPKVGQLQLLRAREQKVLWFDVEVRNAPGMAIRRRIGGLLGAAHQAPMG